MASRNGMGERMIFLTRFDGTEVVVNSDLIVTVEKIPDTVVTLTTGDRIMVKEPIEEVVARAVAYRHRVMQGPGVRDSRDLSSSMRSQGSGPVRAPRDGGDES
jgi:flagellar protein FlbD